MNEWQPQVGEVVQCGVYVGCEYRPSYVGTIVTIHSGCADVDIASMHGAAPWVVGYTFQELRKK